MWISHIKKTPSLCLSFLASDFIDTCIIHIKFLLDLYLEVSITHSSKTDNSVTCKKKYGMLKAGTKGPIRIYD